MRFDLYAKDLTMQSPFVMCEKQDQSPYCEQIKVVVCGNGETFEFTPVPLSFVPSYTQMVKDVKLFPTNLVQVEEIDKIMKKDKNKVFLDFILGESVRFARSEYKYLLQSYIQKEYGQSKVVDIRAVDVWFAYTVNNTF